MTISKPKAIPSTTQMTMMTVIMASKKPGATTMTGILASKKPMIRNQSRLQEWAPREELVDLWLNSSILLYTMKMPDYISAKGPLSCLVIAAENHAARKKKRENTAVEPSSVSFCHDKTASLDPDLIRLIRFSDLFLSLFPSRRQNGRLLQMWMLKY